MSVPLIVGIMLREIYSLFVIQSYTVDYLDLFIGFFTALIIGIFACKWMINLVKNVSVKIFFLLLYFCWVWSDFFQLHKCLKTLLKYLKTPTS